MDAPSGDQSGAPRCDPRDLPTDFLGMVAAEACWRTQSTAALAAIRRVCRAWRSVDSHATVITCSWIVWSRLMRAPDHFFDGKEARDIRCWLMPRKREISSKDRACGHFGSCRSVLESAVAVNAARFLRWFSQPAPAGDHDKPQCCVMRAELLRDPTIITTAIRNSSIAVLALFNELYNLSAEDLRVFRTPQKHLLVLEFAVRQKNDVALRALAHIYGLTADDARIDNNFLFRIASALGYSEVLEVLVADYGLTADDARACHNDALGSATRHGHANVLEFLARRLGLDAADARDASRMSGSIKFSVIDVAGGNGHAEALRVFAREYKLTPADARGSPAFSNAVRAGYDEVLKVLADDFGFKTADARQLNNDAIWKAAALGSAGVLKVLASHYKLNASDARSEDNRTLRVAAMNGHVEVLEVLATVFKLTTEDACATNHAAFYNALVRGHAGVLAVLAKHFNFAEVVWRTPELLKAVQRTFATKTPAVQSVLAEAYSIACDPAPAQ